MSTDHRPHIHVPASAGTHTGGAFTVSGPHLNMEGRVYVGNDPATEKQIEYLVKLMKDKTTEFHPADVDEIMEAWRESGILTRGFASEKIDEYKDLPWRSRTWAAPASSTAPASRAEPGYYTYDRKFYVVVENKAKTGTYAKVLTRSGVEGDSGRWSWEYEKGTVRFLADLKPLTMEEAAAWGHLHGQCFKCLRPLTDPKSVALGMGPTCSKSLKK